MSFFFCFFVRIHPRQTQYPFFSNIMVSGNSGGFSLSSFSFICNIENLLRSTTLASVCSFLHHIRGEALAKCVFSSDTRVYV